jgi:hypothetical protein
MRVLLTKETECGSWPTPKANEPGMSAKTSGRPVEKSTHLTTQVALAEGMINPKTGNMWPTPTVQDADKATKKLREKFQNNLTAIVFNPQVHPAPKTWPTPTCNMVSGGPNHNSPQVIAGKHGINLHGAVLKTWPTPTTRDYKGGNAPRSLTRKDGKSRMDVLPNAVVYGGKTTQQLSELDQTSSKKTLQLNPSWVEWLMGWPIGYTDLKPLGMDKFQRWLELHGNYSLGCDDLQNNLQGERGAEGA